MAPAFNDFNEKERKVLKTATPKKYNPYRKAKIRMAAVFLQKKKKLLESGETNSLASKNIFQE